jgi:hypothetical protein
LIYIYISNCNYNNNNDNTEDSEPQPRIEQAEANVVAGSASDNPSGSSVADSLISLISRKTTKVYRFVCIYISINNYNYNITEDSESKPLDQDAEATAAAASDANNPSGFSEEDCLSYSISRKTSPNSFILSNKIVMIIQKTVNQNQ